MSSLGIDVGATFLRAVWVSSGKVHVLGTWNTPPSPSGIPAVFDAVASRAPSFPAEVGLALAAGVDECGVVTAWPNRAGYVGFGFAAAARCAFGVRPLCLDDCAAAAIAEHGRREDSVTFYLGLGTGIGGAAVVGGEPDAHVPESPLGWGHLQVRAAGETACACGSRGCLQAVAGGRALDRQAAAAGLPVPGYARLAGGGHRAARALVDTVVEPIAQALARAVQLFDPSCIIVGGGLTEAGSVLFDRLGSWLRSQGLGRPLARAALGSYAGAVGAASRAGARADPFARPRLEAEGRCR